jgi:hypothetical protein
MRFLPALVLSISCLAALACSTVPDFAAPVGRVIDESEYDQSDVISYRTLERSDFKGAKPPQEFAANADRIGAATCAYLMTAPGIRAAVSQSRKANGGIRYTVALVDLRFRVQMDRTCSWWNSRQTEVPPSYVLEHEQIHFAIFEIEGRRMNRDRQAIARSLQAAGATPELAAQLAQRNLQEEIQRRLDVILKRSREFDEDTSLGYEPERQKIWRDRVMSELRTTGD